MLSTRFSDKIEKKDLHLVLVPKQAAFIVCDNQVNLVVNPISRERNCFAPEWRDLHDDQPFESVYYETGKKTRKTYFGYKTSTRCCVEKSKENTCSSEPVYRKPNRHYRGLENAYRFWYHMAVTGNKVTCTNVVRTKYDTFLIRFDRLMH